MKNEIKCRETGREYVEATQSFHFDTRGEVFGFETLRRSSHFGRCILIAGRVITARGFLEDRVRKVSRLPMDIIDTTPAVIFSYGKEIKGIAVSTGCSRWILLASRAIPLSGEKMTATSRHFTGESAGTGAVTGLIEGTGGPHGWGGFSLYTTLPPRKPRQRRRPRKGPEGFVPLVKDTVASLQAAKPGRILWNVGRKKAEITVKGVEKGNKTKSKQE